MKVTFIVTRNSLTSPSSTTTFCSFTQAPSILSIVFEKRLMPERIASSKLFVDDAVISVVFATLTMISFDLAHEHESGSHEPEIFNHSILLIVVVDLPIILAFGQRMARSLQIHCAIATNYRCSRRASSASIFFCCSCTTLVRIATMSIELSPSRSLVATRSGTSSAIKPTYFSVWSFL